MARQELRSGAQNPGQHRGEIELFADQPIDGEQFVALANAVVGQHGLAGRPGDHGGVTRRGGVEAERRRKGSGCLLPSRRAVSVQTLGFGLTDGRVEDLQAFVEQPARNIERR